MTASTAAASTSTTSAASGLLLLDNGTWKFAELPGKPLPNWPALRVVNHPKRGRYLIAARPLKAGECILKEEPFVQTVHDDLQDAVCHYCYSVLPRSGAPSPCADCGQIRFCSKECAMACAPIHAIECGLLTQIRGNATARKGVRGLRLFVRLLYQCATDAAGFARVEELEEHYSDAPPERKRFFDGMSAQINKIVHESLRIEPRRLAKLVSRVHTNLHAVADMAGVQYGSALYPRYGSLLNHSCDPSAAVSFHGRTWRLHMLRETPAGSEVAIAYTELYAGRDERRSALKTKKAFDCACSRCERPPPSDARLDGWRCQAAGCGSGQHNAATLLCGVVASNASSCNACGAEHALAPPARAAIVSRWRDAVDSGTNALLNRTESGQSVAVSAAHTALQTVDQMLTQSSGRLCDDHMLRHKALRLRVYALNLIPSGVDAELAEAIEKCVEGMSLHLPPYHPELAFYRFWHAKALTKQAGGGSCGKSAQKALQKRAAEARAAAADGLAIAYGADHPTVRKWRSGQADEEWFVGGQQQLAKA